MAALLIGCVALVSERINTRRKKSKANKREYEQRFEEFKTQNQHTDTWRQQLHRCSQDSNGTSPPQGLWDSQLPQSENTIPQPADGPPSYEDAVGGERERDREAELRIRNSAARERRDRQTAARIGAVEREGKERTSVPLLVQTHVPKNTEQNSDERIAVRDMALAHG